MEQLYILSEQEIGEFLKMLDSLSSEKYIGTHFKNFENIARESEKIYNIVLFGFYGDIHKLQRFYYTHIYIFYPSMYWVSGDGLTSFRRMEHNSMIDFLLFKHPELLNKVETILIARVGDKLLGWKWDRYIFFYEAIGMNYDRNLPKKIEYNKDAWFFELDENYKLVLNTRNGKIVLIEYILG